jgi:hypothetical protein
MCYPVVMFRTGGSEGKRFMIRSRLLTDGELEEYGVEARA